MKRHPRLAKVALALLAPLMCLGAIELTARVMYRPDESLAQPVGNIVTHPVLNHTWRPDWGARHAEFLRVGIEPYMHQYNDRGWLETYDVDPAKPAGTYRVFYLGDSFTEGTCPMESSVPSRVETGLNARAAEGIRFEVINTGTSSYAPVLYDLLARHVLVDYDPDLLVIDVDMTDVFDDFLYRATAELDDLGRLVACPPGSPLKSAYYRTQGGLARKTARYRVDEWLGEHSRFYAVMVSRMRELREAGGEAPATAPLAAPRDEALPGLYDWCDEEWDEDTAELVRASMDTLRQTIELSRSRGFEIVITGVPHLENLTGQFSQRPFEALRALCEDEGVPYLDSFTGVRERIGDADPAVYFIPGDMHYNEAGYGLWADTQLQFLTDPSRPPVLPLRAPEPTPPSPGPAPDEG